MSIGEFCLADLRCQKVILSFSNIHIDAFNECKCVNGVLPVCDSVTRGMQSKWWNYVRWPTHTQLKRRKTRRSIHSIHNVKTHQGKCFYPARLIPIDMITQALHYRLIGTLTTAVCFRVVSGGHFEFYPSKFCEGFPELADE